MIDSIFSEQIEGWKAVFYLTLTSSSYHNQLLPLMQGIKVISVSRSAMQDTVISYPEATPEQTKISTVLRDLDHLITLYQRKDLDDVFCPILPKMASQSQLSRC